MSDILFDTATLQDVIASLPTPKIGLSGKYFPDVVESAEEEINFDIEGTDLRMTPFCSPLSEAPIMQRTGYHTKTFSPAYVKEKTPFTPKGFNKRALGEKIGGELTPAERMERALALDLNQKLKRLELRFDWMATKAMLDGKIVIKGENYPATEVDFGRESNLTTALSGASRWGQSGVSPLEILHTWSSMTETPVTDWYMDAKAYAQLRKDPEAQKRMDMQVRGTNTISNDAILGRDMTMVCLLDGWRIWLMPKVEAKHDDGTTEALFPENTVMGVSDQSFVGIRHFGAIQDVEAIESGVSQGMYHVKSWTKKDPSVRFVMLQSAPLLVPYRPNSTLKATVM